MVVAVPVVGSPVQSDVHAVPGMSSADVVGVAMVEQPIADGVIAIFEIW